MSTKRIYQAGLAPFARFLPTNWPLRLEPWHFLSIVLFANIALVVALAVLGGLRTGDPSRFLGDNILTSAIGAGELLVIAVLAGILFAARRATVAERGFREPYFLWALVSAGFVFLAADKHWDIHESLDSLAHSLAGFRETGLSDRLDDGIVAAYGVCGLIALYLYRKEFSAFGNVRTYLAAGFVSFGISCVCDGLTNRNDIVPELISNPAIATRTYQFLSLGDEAFTLIAFAFFAGAIFKIWHQVRTAAESSETK